MQITTKRAVQTRELLSLVLALLLVLLIAFASYRTWVGFNLSTAELATSQRIAQDTGNLLSLLKDAETGQRGFLLTGKDNYLEPYRNAVLQIPALLEALATDASRRSDQEINVQKLRPLVQRKLVELSQTIAVRRSNGSEAALAIVLSDDGKTTMDQIRQICAHIQATAYGRLARYSSESQASAKQLELLGTVGSLGIFALLVLSTITIQRATSRRRELIEALSRSEERAREARDWLHTTITSIGDGVIATDAAGRITFMNPAAAVLTGWHASEVVGRPLDEIFAIHHEETGAAVENPVRKALRERHVVSLDSQTLLTQRAGCKIPIHDSAAPIRGARDEITGVVMVFRDISEQREAESVKKKAAEDQAHHAALVDQKNAELEHFAYGACHDLREPLRTISAYTEMVRRDTLSTLSEKGVGYLSSVAVAVRRMDHLIQGLLDYSQAGELNAETPQAVLMDEIVDIAIDNLNGSIAESSAVITRDALPAIVGNEIQLEQLIQNLLANALKYRGQEAPRVHISARKDGHGWLFAVSDNGEGIAPEHHANIFTLFKRLHHQNQSGAGIGLSTCQKIVQRYGGRIWVDSQVGKGSTFFFTWPRAAEESQARAFSAAPSA